MDGWIDRQTDRQVGRWMDGWMDGWMVRSIQKIISISPVPPPYTAGSSAPRQPSRHGLDQIHTALAPTQTAHSTQHHVPTGWCDQVGYI